MRTKNMIISDITRFQNRVNETKQRIKDAQCMPISSSLRSEVLEALEDELRVNTSRLNHWQDQLDIFEGNNVSQINTPLNQYSDQYKIELALKNLIETFGRDAIVEVNQSLKLTRKSKPAKKRAA